MNHLRNAFLAIVAVAATTAVAVEPTEEVRRMAGNYYAYPYPANPLPELTAAPEGYTPYHIEHYGRHGSRWHIGEHVYSRPVETLAKAEAAGKLTPRGQELLAQLRVIAEKAVGRDGELTDIGAEQHRGIAQRMYANFPEVFADGSRVDARSTVVIRCILSMDNELQELKAANPKLNITSDASHADMKYMNRTDKLAKKSAANADSLVRVFYSTHNYMGDFLPKLVTDTAWANDSLNVPQLFGDLFIIAGNAQSHKDQKAPYDIFSDREIKERWEYNNVSWFTDYGNMALTGHNAPFRQKNLLRNMVESADTTIGSTFPSANLRFGHEVVVLPLVTLMELDSFGDEINDLDQVASRWKNYDIFPMACNVQMIFYRPVDPKSDKPVLVKVLLNEKEAALPVKPVSRTSPYVRWSDLRDYYTKKLDAYDLKEQPE
ncbi:MAG: histidine-type phosphatase [Paramuribaculum sp.]|nr:histidine-type phosphatase [Paramuribaculum sp.]